MNKTDTIRKKAIESGQLWKHRYNTRCARRLIIAIEDGWIRYRPLDRHGFYGDESRTRAHSFQMWLVNASKMDDEISAEDIAQIEAKRLLRYVEDRIGIR